MSATKWKVGDTVLLVEGRTAVLAQRAGEEYEPTLHTITRVGRTYAYFTRLGMEYGFDMDTGRVRHGWGYHDYCYSPERWAELAVRSRLLNRLRGKISFTGTFEGKLTTLQLERIAAIVEEEH